MKPRRIQLSRAKGWRMPPNTVKVDRSSKRFGNPFRVGQAARLADEGVCDARARAAEAAAERALEAAARPLGPEIDADTADAMRERS